MGLPPSWFARRRVVLAACLMTVGAALFWLHPQVAAAALARAAGKESTAEGGAKHDAGGGFTELLDFLNQLGTYAMYLGGAYATLGFIRAGVEYQSGSPNAARTAGGAVIGLVLVLLAKAITA
jgi:hypothetical protein